MPVVVQYAVSANDVDVVAKRLSKNLKLSFVRHGSDYLGPYLEHGGFDWPKVKIYFNFDPMWRADTDPPEEQFFKSDFSGYRVLIDATLSEADQANLFREVQEAFPGSVEIYRGQL